MLNRFGVVPSNIAIQNLIEFIEKCETEVDTKNEVNSLSQISLLIQGTTGRHIRLLCADVY